MTSPSPDADARLDELAADAETLERALFHLTRLERRRFVVRLERFEITPAQYVALVQLARLGHGCTMGRLSSALQQSSATMTGIVDRIVRQGLAERQHDPDDRRRVIVAITDAGRRLLTEANSERRQFTVEALGELEPADRRQLVRLLEIYLALVAERDGGRR